MGRKALLVIDLQQDFLPGGALAAAPGSERIVPVVNKLLDASVFDLRVASTDWHPEGHISFASTHGKSPGESVPHRGIQQPLWPEHCVQGTPGADHPTDLTQHRWDHVVRKGSALDADASSPFRDLHGADLGLAAFLRERGVQARLRAAEVCVCGLVTEVCVRAAALDAAKMGFTTVVVEDACGALEKNPGDEARVLDELRAAGATVTTSAALLGSAQG